MIKRIQRLLLIITMLLALSPTMVIASEPNVILNNIDENSININTSAEIEIVGNVIYANGGRLTILDGDVAGETRIELNGVLFDFSSSGAGLNSYDLSEYTIFGGSRNNSYNGDTHIIVKGGEVASIYGGNHNTMYADNDAELTNMTGNTYIIIEGGTVSNHINSIGHDVVGGGLNSSVIGNTNIILRGGDVATNIYGGGEISNNDYSPPSTGILENLSLSANVSGKATINLINTKQIIDVVGGGIIRGNLEVENLTATVGSTEINFYGNAEIDNIIGAGKIFNDNLIIDNFIGNVTVDSVDINITNTVDLSSANIYGGSSIFIENKEPLNYDIKAGVTKNVDIYIYEASLNNIYGGTKVEVDYIYSTTSYQNISADVGSVEIEILKAKVSNVFGAGHLASNNPNTNSNVINDANIYVNSLVTNASESSSIYGTGFNNFNSSSNFNVKKNVNIKVKNSNHVNVLGSDGYTNIEGNLDIRLFNSNGSPKVSTITLAKTEIPMHDLETGFTKTIGGDIFVFVDENIEITNSILTYVIDGEKYPASFKGEATLVLNNTTTSVGERIEGIELVSSSLTGNRPISSDIDNILMLEQRTSWTMPHWVIRGNIVLPAEVSDAIEIKKSQELYMPNDTSLVVENQSDGSPGIFTNAGYIITEIPTLDPSIEKNNIAGKTNIASRIYRNDFEATIDLKDAQYELNQNSKPLVAVPVSKLGEFLNITDNNPTVHNKGYYNIEGYSWIINNITKLENYPNFYKPSTNKLGVTTYRVTNTIFPNFESTPENSMSSLTFSDVATIKVFNKVIEDSTNKPNEDSLSILPLDPTHPSDPGDSNKPMVFHAPVILESDQVVFENNLPKTVADSVLVGLEDGQHLFEYLHEARDWYESKVIVEEGETTHVGNFTIKIGVDPESQFNLFSNGFDWSIFNMVITLFIIVYTGLCLYNDRIDFENNEQVLRKTTKLVLIGSSLISMLLLFLTQDFIYGVSMFDEWSITFAGLFTLVVIVSLTDKGNITETEEQNN